MTEKLTTYDLAAALVDEEEIAFFMADAVDTGDSTYIAKALGLVDHAKKKRGIVKDAEWSGSLECRNRTQE